MIAMMYVGTSKKVEPKGTISRLSVFDFGARARCRPAVQSTGMKRLIA